MELISAISPDTTFCGMPLKDVIQVTWGKKSAAQCGRENPGLMPSYLEEAVEMFRQVYELGVAEDGSLEGQCLVSVGGSKCVLEDLPSYGCEWRVEWSKAEYNTSCGLLMSAAAFDHLDLEMIQQINDAHLAHHRSCVCRAQEFPHGKSWRLHLGFGQDIAQCTDSAIITDNQDDAAASDKDVTFDRCTLGVLQVDQEYKMPCGLRLSRDHFKTMDLDELVKFNEEHRRHHDICINDFSFPHGIDWYYMKRDETCLKGTGDDG